MNNNDKTTADQEFFIPDLCNVQAVLFLVLVAELLAFVLELADGSLQSFSWQSFSLTSLFVLWSFLLSAALLCQIRPRLTDWPLAKAASACYLLILAVVASTSIMGQWMLQGALAGAGDWSIDGWQLTTDILICGVLAGIILRYFYLTQQLRLNQRAELQARIQALQSRIRPHFLFNSMNIIASLIAVDQEAAETAVEDLAGLFRASLAEAQTEVTLADELELCRRYARIEQLRLGDRLNMDWQLDDAPHSLPIPSLTLQPLLENAIYHGIQQLPKGGVVTINAALSEDIVTLSVINPVMEHVPSDVDGNQLAQDNIHRRLQALYGPRASLTTKMVDGDHHAVIVYPVVGRVVELEKDSA
ncbi:sensor histidine kinase [Oceanicoccus sagamiensis]|uniref:Histidine kinase n=1 Tax=Oceanicoccus sagamiensis TaxID=716816 RepID=A0A1X9N7V5_9GAMM|nr:histidine kinase [Oceanicoccus sagamiensis]ARN74150.1 histidine kinase [Oceanicoccus sagamiensis]